MKFYELDIAKLLPNGILINTESHVEYTNYINDFFLKGFEGFYSQLFTTSNSELNVDFSRSCTAPNSIFACQFCNDAQIQSYIESCNFDYYTLNDHNVNAAFMYALANESLGTINFTKEIVKYISNNSSTQCEVISEYVRAPYDYDLYISGDITSTCNTETLFSRLLSALKKFNTAHTQLVNVVVDDTGSTLHSYAGVLSQDASITCESTILNNPIPTTYVLYGNYGQEIKTFCSPLIIGD